MLDEVMIEVRLRVGYQPFLLELQLVQEEHEHDTD